LHFVVSTSRAAADDDTETNPMSLENVAKEKYMGKVKGKLSLFSIVTDVFAAVILCAAHRKNIPNYKLIFSIISRVR
jgi:hypothetical protein